jgi:hypothetical protein
VRLEGFRGAVAGPAAGDGAAPMGLGRGQRAGPKGWSNHGQTLAAPPQGHMRPVAR